MYSAPPVSMGNRRSNRVSSALRGSTFTHVAASSTASGQTVQRPQIASTVASSTKVGSTARARSTKRATASLELSGCTVKTLFPVMRSGSRLVTRKCTEGHAASNDASKGATAATTFDVVQHQEKVLLRKVLGEQAVWLRPIARSSAPRDQGLERAPVAPVDAVRNARRLPGRPEWRAESARATRAEQGHQPMRMEQLAGNLKLIHPAINRLCWTGRLIAEILC